MPFSQSTTIANDQVTALGDTFAGGKLRIYTGAQPASADAAVTGTLLVEQILPSPAFAAPSGGVRAKAGTWQGTAVAGGTAGWGRLSNGVGDRKIDGTVTISGGGGQFIIDSVSVVSGAVITTNTANLSVPLS